MKYSEFTPEQKASRLASGKRWRDRNPDKVRAKNASWAKANPDQKKKNRRDSYARRAEFGAREAARRWAVEHPKETRRAIKSCQLKKLYGISIEDYDRMYESQSGLCAICKKKNHRALNVDHCHRTGKVRGLLCDGCNCGIGRLKDDAALLRIAAAYLEGHE